MQLCLRLLPALLVASLLAGCAGPGQFSATPNPQPATSTLPPEATAARPAPTPTVALPYETPDWFKTAVLYQVFVRSFRDSNGDNIGDLDGITEQLDYLQSLGVTALWLTPIFAAGSYHGYDTLDYYAINPDFGTRADLQELVDAAHTRGMRIILDYVASHTSNEHPFFKSAYGNPASPYADWYRWKDAAHTTYFGFANLDTLPTLNHKSDAVNAYFIDLALHWLDLDDDGDFTDGIDGWRADYALGSPPEFWQTLRVALKTANPEALLLGEVWVNNVSTQAPYYQQFDALFDFPLQIALMAGPESALDGALAGVRPAAVPANVILEQQTAFPAEAIPVRFLSNHDTDRIATEVEGAPERLRLAAVLLATLSGTPMLYYGEEIGMRGHKGGPPLYDAYRREPMDWHAAEGPGQARWFEPEYWAPKDGISVEEQDGDSASLLSFYRQVLALRAAHPALARGDYAPLPAGPEPGVWAFWRFAKGEIIAVVLNLGQTPATATLDLLTGPGALRTQPPTNLLTGQPAELDPAAITLQPAEALVLDFTP